MQRRSKVHAASALVGGSGDGRPVELPTFVRRASMAGGGVWVRREDEATGAWYWYNPLTDTSVWSGSAAMVAARRAASPAAAAKAMAQAAAAAGEASKGSGAAPAEMGADEAVRLLSQGGVSASAARDDEDDEGAAAAAPAPAPAVPVAKAKTSRFRLRSSSHVATSAIAGSRSSVGLRRASAGASPGAATPTSATQYDLRNGGAPSGPYALMPPVSISGMLMKLSGNTSLLARMTKKKWQVRFVALRGNLLTYYVGRDQFREGQAPQAGAFIDTRQYALSTQGGGGDAPPGTHSFRLVNALDNKARIFSFNTDDATTYDAWVEALTRVTKRQLGGGTL